MPRQKTGNIRINFMLPPKVLTAYKALAKRRGTTYSELLRVAAKEFIIKELKTEKGDS
jgi:hypothetical protein